MILRLDVQIIGTQPIHVLYTCIVFGEHSLWEALPRLRSTASVIGVGGRAIAASALMHAQRSYVCERRQSDTPISISELPCAYRACIAKRKEASQREGASYSCIATLA